MEKEKVLVCDNKRVFLKMFKSKFEHGFEFNESYFLSEKKNKSKNFDHFIYVVYDKFEVLQFLSLYKKENKVLVFLFNKRYYNNLAFLEQLNSLVLFDSTKTRNEIVGELKLHFKIKHNYVEKMSKINSIWFNFFNKIYNFFDNKF